MEYVIPLALVLVVVTAAVVLLVTRSAQKGGSPSSTDGDGPGIGADSASPLGDTPEHAGEQREGVTVANQDAARHGGSAHPATGSYESTGHEDGEDEDTARVQRYGEAEGAARI